MKCDVCGCEGRSVAHLNFKSVGCEFEFCNDHLGLALLVQDSRFESRDLKTLLGRNVWELENG